MKIKLLLSMLVLFLMSISCSEQEVKPEATITDYQEMADKTGSLITRKTEFGYSVYFPKVYINEFTGLQFTEKEKKIAGEDAVNAIKNKLSGKQSTYPVCGGLEGCTVSYYYELYTNTTGYCYFESPTGKCKTAYMPN